MSFFRENLFLVVLIGVTLVLSLGLVGWGYSITGQIDEQEMVERRQLSDQIENLGRPPFANGITNDRDRKEKEGVIGTLENVRNEDVHWNSRNFTVPDLKMLNDEIRPALPYDAQVWRSNNLALVFVEQYHQVLDELLQSLQATSPPTDESIATEAKHQADLLERRRMREEKRTGGAAGAAPDRPAAMPAPMNPAAGMYNVPMPGTSVNVGTEAMERAEANLRLRKAREGLIYADWDSFDVMFVRGGLLSTIEPGQVWDAQVSLWVQADIVAVISETIQQAQKEAGLDPKQGNVTNSPIKRLEKIDIAVGERREAPVERTPERRWGGGPAAPPGAMPPDMPGYGPPGMAGAPGYPRPAAAPGGYPPAPRPMDYQAPQYGTAAEKAETLTGYTADRLYDIVNYSFTVVMPTRYLPYLEQNLMKRNYHIILNEEITPVGETSSTTGSPTGVSASTPQSRYYYGAEPVQRVTISGQLLLLTDFTRGVWDEGAKKWRYPPLMPREVMKTLPAAALRREDSDLLENRLPMPWSPSAVNVQEQKTSPMPVRSRLWRGGQN